MNNSTDLIFRSQSSDDIKLRRMLITEISITQDSTPSILCQVSFELTKSPSRAWKEALLDTWYSITKHNSEVFGSVIWAIQDCILVNNVPIELVGNELETIVSTTVDQTNNQMAI